MAVDAMVSTDVESNGAMLSKLDIICGTLVWR